jgi:hypothetical protein
MKSHVSRFKQYLAHPTRLLTLTLLFTNHVARAEEHPCDGVQCSNKGYCIEDKQYNRGYWCSCDPGWVGQDCTYPQPTVQCGDQSIRVSIDKGIVRELQIDDDPKFVYFGQMDSVAENMCRAREDDDEYVLEIRAPFTGCGTQVLRQAIGDDYTFSNTVVWNSEVNTTTNINRELILLDFKCIYQDQFTITAPNNIEGDRMAVPTINSLRFLTEHGSFAVSMNIYGDSSFAKSKEYQQAPSIAIGSYVYVQVELENVDDGNLVVSMDNCFATQTRDPFDPTTAKHFLVINRCTDKESDPTVQIYANGESHKSRFKFQMFKWRWSADDVFLHCEVDICNKTSEVCTAATTTTLGQCNGVGETRRKRDLAHEGTYVTDFDQDFGDNILTKGPLRVEIEDNLIDISPEEYTASVDTTMIYLGVSLGFVLAVLGVVVGSIIRKRRAQTSKLAQLEAERRLTQYRFTREAF